MSERDVQTAIMLELSSRGVRIFRNNTGVGWQGETVKKWRADGDEYLILKNPRPLHAGLHVGSSDLIGWTPVTIQPEHLGQTLAVFTAVEVKYGRRTTTPEQANFIEQVQRAGGFSGVARDLLDLDIILSRGK